MRNTIYTFILVALIVASCSKDDFTVNQELFGRWQTPGAVYTFRADESYAIEYVNDGEEFAPIADSVFGDYIHNNGRSTITFFQQGYRNEDSQELIFNSLNGGTWKYSIDGDELTYSSPTQDGLLKKISD